MKSWILFLSLMTPCVGFACESSTVRNCEKQVAQLISYRTQAIEYAFGELSALPDKIDVKFVSQKDKEYAQFAGRLAYDRENKRMVVPRRYATSKMPNPMRAAINYWPFYQDDLYIDEFPIIGAIDNAIWSAYLQEAALASGQSWPHENCLSVDIGKRLPCEMVLEGIVEFITTTRTAMFNENRLDRIWPEDFDDFQRRVVRDQNQYRDVQRYGGIMLVRPLIGQFGVPRVLAYIAQTPFVVEESSMREAALKYQARAREALSSGQNADTLAVSSITRDALSATPP
jgi:hypothetical protein